MDPVAALAPNTDIVAYQLLNAPSHIAAQRRWEDLADLLFDPNFLRDKLSIGGVASLLADFDFIGEADFKSRNPLLTLRSAIRLCASILEMDPGQLASQLTARLFSSKDPDLVEVCVAFRHAGKPWLRLCVPSLVQAGSMLERSLPRRVSAPQTVGFANTGDLIGIDGATLRGWSITSGDEQFALPLNSSGAKVLALDRTRTALVYGTADGEIVAWDLKKRRRLWERKLYAPQCIEVAPEHGLVLVLGEGGVGVTALDWQSGIDRRFFDSDVLEAIAITPDGSSFLGGSMDGRIDLWSLENGQEIRHFAHHGSFKGPRIAAADLLIWNFAKKGIWVQSGEKDIQSLDFSAVPGLDPELVGRLKGLKELPDPTAAAISTIRFDDKGTCVFTGSRDHSIGVWAWPSGEHLRSLTGHSRQVSSIVALASSDMIITGAADGTVRLWNLSSGTELQALYGRGVPIERLALSPDERRVAASNSQGDVEIYDLEALVPVPLVSHPGGVWAVSAINELGRIYSIGSSGIQIRDASDMSLLRKINLESGDVNEILSCTSDGRRMLGSAKIRHAHSSLAELVVFDLEDGLIIQSLEDKPPASWNRDWAADWRFTDAAADDAGKYMISVSQGSAVPSTTQKAALLALWDLTTATRTFILSERAANAPLAMSPDGTTALAVVDDQLIVWDPSDGRELGRLAVPSGVAIGMATDSHTCVIAGQGNLIWVDLRPTLRISKEIKLLESSRVSSLAFNSNSTLLITAHDDGSLQLWEPRGFSVARIGTDAPLMSCAFASANTIVAGDALGRIHLVSVEEHRPMHLDRAPKSNTTTNWHCFDEARRLDRQGASAQAIHLWLKLATQPETSYRRLGALAIQTLQTLGFTDSVALVHIEMALAAKRPPDERLDAVEKLRDGRFPDAIVQVALRVMDASFTSSGQNGIRVVIAACRALAAIGAWDQLRQLVQVESTPTLVRIAAADILFSRQHNEMPGRFLRDCATDSSNPAPLRLAAQKALITELDGEDAIAFLVVQAQDQSFSPEQRQIAVEQIARLGEIGTPILRIFGDKGPMAEFVVRESAIELSDRGMRLFMVGDFDGASAALREASELEPTEPRHHFNLGALFLRQARNEEAVNEFSRAIAMTPLYEKAYGERGTAYRCLRQYDLAIQDYSRAIELNEKEVHNYLQRAQVYRLLGQEDLAGADEMEATRREPEYRGPEALELKPATNASSGPERPAPTVSASAALIRLGQSDRLSSKFFSISCDPSMSVEIRAEALSALRKLGRMSDLKKICSDRNVDDVTRALAATEWVILKPGPEVERLLVTMICNKRLAAVARHQAAEAIVEHLPKTDLIALLRAIPDTTFISGEMSVGLQVAAQLIRAESEKSGLDQVHTLAVDTKVPGGLRELAAESIALAGGDDSLGPLEKLAAEPRLDHESQKQAERALRVIKQRRQQRPPHATPEEEAARGAFEQWMNATNGEAVAALAQNCAFLTTFSCILQARMAVEHEHEDSKRQRLARNLRWLEDLAATPFEKGFRSAFDASTKDQMRSVVEQYAFLSEPRVQESMAEIVKAICTPAIQIRFSERLRWLKSIPIDPSQAAITALTTCRSKEEVARVADVHTRIRSSSFISQLEHAIDEQPAPEAKERGRQILAWVEEIVGGKANSLLDEGIRCYEGDDFKRSIKLLTQALNEDPELRFAYMMRGLASAALEDHRRAIDDFTRYIELGGKTPGVYEQRGRANMMLKRAAAAIADFSRAIEMESDNQKALLGRALAFQTINQHQKSEADFELLVKLGTTNASVYAYLAVARAATNPEEALSYLDKAITLDPDNGDFDSLRTQILRSLRSSQGDEARGAEGRAAAEAVQAARDSKEMETAVAKYQILRDMGFLRKLLEQAETFPDKVRPAIVQRVQAAYQIAFQMAFDALMTAKAKEIQKTVAEHQILGDSEFVGSVKKMLESRTIPIEHRDRVSKQLQLLEQLHRS